MVSVNLDDKTARKLTALAADQGMSLEDYLRKLAHDGGENSTDQLSVEQFDGVLGPLLFDGPSLPADFSRSDIYTDHD